VKEFPATLKYVTVWLVLGTLVFLGYRWYEVQQQRERISFLKDSSGAGVLHINLFPAVAPPETAVKL
jgi:hypothetical protein